MGHRSLGPEVMRGGGGVRILWAVDIKGQRERKGEDYGIQK